MSDLLQLTAILTNQYKSLDKKRRAICQAAADFIPGADRVSLWRFSPERDRIQAVLCLDNQTQTFTSGHILTQQDNAEYFDAILKEQVVNAPDARQHPSTQCFTQDYFEPLNIYSLLDVILHTDFQPSGIICCESVGQQTQWRQQDVELLKKIARTSSMYFTMDSDVSESD